MTLLNKNGVKAIFIRFHLIHFVQGEGGEWDVDGINFLQYSGLPFQMASESYTEILKALIAL